MDFQKFVVNLEDLVVNSVKDRNKSFAMKIYNTLKTLVNYLRSVAMTTVYFIVLLLRMKKLVLRKIFLRILIKFSELKPFY